MHTYIHTYIHTLSDFSVKSTLQRIWSCSKNTTKHKVLKHTYMIKFLKKTCFRKLLSMYVCLKSLCFIMENVQPKLSKHIIRCPLYERVIERVCMFQNPLFCRVFCNSNITRPSETHGFFKFSKRYRARYYINTSIPSFRPSH